MSSWKSVMALPAASANLSAVFHKHWLFAIGGATELTAPATFQGVLRANVESNDGTIGPWVTAAAPSSGIAFPDNKFGATAASIGHRSIMLAGGAPTGSGSTGPTATKLNGGAEILMSSIDVDGNLSPWVYQSALPINVSQACLVASQGWAYLVGGNQLQASVPYNGETPQKSLPYNGGIVGGPFLSGETVTGGTSAATIILNAGASAAAGVLTGYVTGVFVNGETLTGGTSAATTTANIGGSLVTNNFVSGETIVGQTSAAKLVLNAAFSTASGTFTGFSMVGGPFTNTETVIGQTSGAKATINSASGGTVTTVVNTGVYKARINADKTVFGPWQLVGVLPSGVIGNTLNNVVVWRNEYMYLFDQATLWKVRLNRDGDFMSANLPASFGGNGWLPFGGPPTGFATLQQHMMCLINQNELMLIGGQDGSNASKSGVFSLHLDGDGNPTGAWQETMNLPTAVDSAAVVSAGNMVFVIGGSASGTATTQVLAARIGPSGRIGAV